MEARARGLKFRLALVWLALLLSGLFWLSGRQSLEVVSLSVLPQIPRQGEPVVATFKLNNPDAQPLAIRYQFYANGQLLKQGATIIAPGRAKAYQYAYLNPLKLGEQLNFVVRAESGQGGYLKAVSLPAYPPQVWSSFASFATMSTSVMSSLTTMSYYRSNFGISSPFDVGWLSSLVLVALLVFLELTQPLLQGTPLAFLVRVRARFSLLTWILLVIFVGIVFNRVALVLMG